ncbi:hypothetical protein MOF8_16485 [Methylobacterium oryzae]
MSKPLAAALVLAALTSLAPPPARAASFPCDRAEAPDETAICAHLALNDRDVEMATRFEILKSVLPMGGQAKLRDDQEAWLTERRACGRPSRTLLIRSAGTPFSTR